MMDKHFLSRRRMLKQATTTLAALAAIPIFMVSSRAYASLAAKSDFHYQDHPKDGKKCADCAAFLPSSPNAGIDGTCRVISGAISPNGWCMAFTSK
jgi:hypothetical protein